MTEQKEILAAAQAALEDAFGPDANKHTVKITSTPSNGLTASELFPLNPEYSAQAAEILKMAKSPREIELASAVLKQLSKLSSSEFSKLKEEIKTEFPRCYEYLFECNLSNKSHGLTFSDLHSIVTEVGGKLFSISEVIEACNQSTETPAKKKSVAETKKLLTTFHKRMEKYAKHLSIDGATLICVKLSLHSPAEIDIDTLPKSDQQIIEELISNTPFKGRRKFYVTMDEMKDFQVIFSDNKEDGDVFYLFNSVVHPPFNQASDVPVAQDGTKIIVGANLVLDQHRIRKLVGNAPPEKLKNDDEDMPRRQPVAGRNAFELRCDLVQLSMDLLFHNNRGTEISPEKVITAAKTLYAFVEDRNRR